MLVMAGCKFVETGGKSVGIGTGGGFIWSDGGGEALPAVQARLAASRKITARICFIGIPMVTGKVFEELPRF